LTFSYFHDIISTSMIESDMLNGIYYGGRYANQ
jgi:hypothetical protein